MGSRGSHLQLLAVMMVKVFYVMCNNETCMVGQRASLDHYSSESSLSDSQTLLLLDLINSASCNCTLNTWSFCYRATRNSEMLGDSSISVGIWRYDADNNTYSLDNGTLTVLPDGGQYSMFEFEILCQRIIVPRFNVLERDVVGALVHPAMVSVVGFDPSSKIWMNQTSDIEILRNSQLKAVERQGLYVEALYTDPEEFPTLLTTTTTTTVDATMGSEGTSVSSRNQNIWAIYAFAVVVLCLVVLTVATFSLCYIVMVKRQKRAKESISTGHGDTILTNVGITPSREKNEDKVRDGAETNATSQVNYTVLRDILPSPIVIENTNRETAYHQAEARDGELSVSSSKVRSATFTYPPPEDKAPSPPGAEKAGRRASELDVVLQRPLPLSPLSASSLPNLLSDQDEDGMYDNVRSPISAKSNRSPAPGRNKGPRTRNSAPPPRSKPNAPTFKFPPPETKPPAPPSEDNAPRGDGRESPHSPQHAGAGALTLPNSSMVPAVSLPDLYSKHEDTYDKVLASPSPYVDCTSLKKKAATAANGHISTPPQARSGAGRRSSADSASPKTIPHYKNTKTKVGRLQSAPITSKSPEYAEPITPEQRARFYSHRGMKVPISTHKLGPAKAQMPTPCERPRTLPPPSQHSSVARLTSSCENLLSSEHSLEKIPEMEEAETPTPSSQNGPSLYLEPVKSKPRNSKSS